MLLDREWFNNGAYTLHTPYHGLYPQCSPPSRLKLGSQSPLSLQSLPILAKESNFYLNNHTKEDATTYFLCMFQKAPSTQVLRAWFFTQHADTRQPTLINNQFRPTPKPKFKMTVQQCTSNNVTPPTSQNHHPNCRTPDNPKNIDKSKW